MSSRSMADPRSRPIEIALFQPDIPTNTGTILRLAACLDLRVHVIGPTGFDMSDRALARAGLDYARHAALVRHLGWDAFLSTLDRPPRRLVLATARGSSPLPEFAFMAGDILLFGRESAGVPEAVHALADARVRIPMVEGRRSLNLAVAVAMVAGEALRQTEAWPR